MNFSTLFITKPVATTLLACGVALAGITAFNLLPVSSLPQVDFPTIVVQASLPGASPTTMATSVATPLERRIGRIAGITEMTSSSSFGTSSITIQFDLDRNIDGAARDVQAAINASLSDLPTDMPGLPTYRKVNPSDAPIIIITLTSKIYAVGQMYDVASTILQQRISQIEGIGQVRVGGSSLPAVRIQVNPMLLSSFGISMEQVAQAVENTNGNGPKGQLISGDTISNIVTDDQLFKVEEYKKVIVAYSNGAPVRVGDIANVIDSVEDINNAGFSGENPAVVLIISKQPGANVIEAVERIKAAMPLLQSSIMQGIDLKVVVDRTITIRSSLHEVEMTLVFAALLVIFVVYISLGNARAALIPSVAVPLSLLGTFGLMYLCDYSLDNLSLMALTIVTGFVVDDAVVVLENITRHIEEGKAPLEASILGTQEVGFTVLSMSTSLIAVFIPILLMGGIVGRLFREFAMCLSIAILVSLIISLTVTPMMCARVLRKNSHNPKESMSNRFINTLKRYYHTSLNWALDHSKFMQLITFITLALTIALYVIVPKGFFPQQDSGRIIGSVQTQQDMSFKEIKSKLTGYINIISKDPSVQNVAGFVNASSSGGNSGSVFITLKPLENRDANADQIINRLRGKLTAITGATLLLQSAQDLVIGGRQGNAQFQYTISADTLADLNEWAPKIMDKLSKLPGIADINSDQRDQGLQSYVQIDRDTASRLGVTAEQIDLALNNAFGQRQISTLYKTMNQYHIVMTVADEFWQNPDVLKQIYVPSNSGLQVPLAAFSTISISNLLLAVNHQGQFPSATLSFNLLPGAALGDVVDSVDKALQSMTLPANVYGSFQGTAKAFKDSVSNEMILVVAAILAVYIVLGVLYESLIHPITILSTLPSAGLGALVALLVTRTDLTIIALIGIILLIGIVKKNAIMMVDFALHLRRTENKSPREAIFIAAQLRFRPIMMTTLAAIFGALPLVLSRGVGYELRQPLGISIIGGLIFSQALTLYTTPVIYLTMDRFADWCKTRLSASYPSTTNTAGGVA